MKSIFCFLTSLLFLTFAAISQTASTTPVQTVSPHEIYVGDVAVISYTFYSPINFPLGAEDFCEISFSDSFLNTDSYSIKNGYVSREGNQYQLSITFVPWQTGTISFEKFDLLSLLDRKTSGFVIDLSPVTVSSILKKTGKESLQTPSPPVLIPGTIYVVCIISIFAFILLIIFVKILLNFQGLINLFDKINQYLEYGKNARKAMKEIRYLEKKGSGFTDQVFCLRIEKMFRNYLSYRFDESFLSLTSNLIEQRFNELMCDALPLSISLRVESLGSLFRRLDYIRYAQNSIDNMRLPANKYLAAFDVEERKQVLQTSRELIKFFEKSEENQFQENEKV